MIVGERNNWIKPEFRALIFSVNVYMSWLTTVVGVEIKTIRTDSQSSWHFSLSICSTTNIAKYIYLSTVNFRITKNNIVFWDLPVDMNVVTSGGAFLIQK